MPYLIDAALDALLDYVRTNAAALHICSQEPTNFTQATSTYSLGVKTSPTIASPSDKSGGGRECVVGAITDGSTTGTGVASHWAIVSGSVLLAANALGASQGVTSGNPFTLTSFAYGVTDAVSV